MATRGVIARTGKTEGEFSGVYHHWDSQPHSLGRTLLELHHGFFKGDLDHMLRVLIDEHNAWSTVVDRDFRLKPGFTNDPTKTLKPICYCHGQRHEQNPRITHEDMNDTDVEWVYAFDVENNRLYIRDIRFKEEAGFVDLAGPMLMEKQWYEIECGKDFHRCSHMAWAHELTPTTSNLSTQAWLGNRPLEFHDAIGFIISGKRYTATGCGGNSGYYNNARNRMHSGIDHMKPFPANAWIASVKAGNGRRIDVPVALIDGREYKRFPGVRWIMPATKNEPEQIIGGAQ